MDGLEAKSVRRSLTRMGNDRVHALHAGSGPPVVLLHGLAGSSAWWRHTIPALAQHFAVHAPDLVGFGRSRGVRGRSVHAYAASIGAWLEQRGISRAHFIGHSMGGEIALHIAAGQPELVEKLVLVSAAGVPRPISLTQAARFLAEIIPPRSWGAPHFLPRIALDTMRAGAFSVARAATNILRDDVRPLLAQITAPTLLIWGTLDALTPVRDGEYMASHIRNARLTVFEGAAHMPMIDQSERFNAEVIGFLAS